MNSLRKLCFQSLTKISSLGLIFSALFSQPKIQAASLFWDADLVMAGAQDGFGVWDLSNPNWLNAGSNESWANLVPPHSAVFGASNGSGGSIDITDTIHVQNINFEATTSGNYTLTSSIGGQIDLAANSVITVNHNATIQAWLNSSTGFTKAGASTLTFSGSTSNTITGTTNIQGGTLELNKTGGALALGGNIEIQTGGKLAWRSNPQQIHTDTQITLEGGEIIFNNHSATFQSYTQNSGKLSGSNTGAITVNGTFRMAGGGTYTINSGGRLNAHTVDLTGFGNSEAFNVGGNSSSIISGLVVGPGGLIMSGQTIRLNYAPSASSLGSWVSLQGNLTASGTNLFTSDGASAIYPTAVSQVNLGTAERTFHIESGNTTFNRALSLAGTGGLKKTGAGTLIFSMTANSDAVNVGTLKIEEGVVQITQDELLHNSTDVNISGGRLDLLGKTETLQNLTMTSGQFVSGNNAKLNVSGIFTLNGTTTITLNSGSIISANQLNAINSTVPVIGGASTTQVTQIQVGANGLHLQGQALTLNRITTEGHLGSEIVLNGNLTSSGTSAINLSATGALASTAKANFRIEGANRSLQITDTLSISASVAGTGSWIKTGSGALTLHGSLHNTHSGTAILREGTLNLNKSMNVDSIASDLKVEGGLLHFTQSHQINDLRSIHLTDGAINFNSRSETFASFTKEGGDTNSTAGNITITGTFKGIGGTSLAQPTNSAIYTINSGGQTSAYELDFSESVKSYALLLGGNSPTLTRMIVGAGGLKINNNTFTFNRDNAGSELTLNGDVTASGNNTFSKGTAGTSGTRLTQIHHGAATRAWNITSGTTTSHLPIISSGGGLEKLGSGKLVLNDINTYSGKTRVSAGTLESGAAGGFSASPWFEIAAGATLHVNSIAGGFQLNQSATPVLSGSGTVIGSVTLANGASIRPGMSSNQELQNTAGTLTGSLNISGNVNGTQTTTNTIALFNIASASEADRLSITGNLSLNNHSNIKVEFDSSFDSYKAGDSWTLIDWSGTLTNSGFDTGLNGRTGLDGLGNEANLDLPTLLGDLYWNILPFETGKHLSIMIIPEPSKSLFILLGLCGLTLRRRR